MRQKGYKDKDKYKFTKFISTVQYTYRPLARKNPHKKRHRFLNTCVLAFLRALFSPQMSPPNMHRSTSGDKKEN